MRASTLRRALGGAVALLLAGIVGVPAVVAADPWDQGDRVLIVTDGDVTVPAGEHADLVLVTGGSATIEGDVRMLVVVDGQGRLTGAHAADVLAVRSSVSIDEASTVTGDVQSFDATIDAAPGSIQGTVIDLGPALAGFLLLSGLAALGIYLGWLLLAAILGLALAGLAARQVRETTTIIVREPLLTAATALGGIVALAIVAGLAMLTIVGIPFGLVTLLVALPALLLAGYLVAAIAVGDAILGRVTPGRVRERPYLASLVGLVVLGCLGVVPVITGIAAMAGFGALLVRMWRGFRAPGLLAPVEPAPVSWPVA